MSEFLRSTRALMLLIVCDALTTLAVIIGHFRGESKEFPTTTLLGFSVFYASGVVAWVLNRRRPVSRNPFLSESQKGPGDR